MAPKTGVLQGAVEKRALAIRLEAQVNRDMPCAPIWFAVLIQTIEDLVKIRKVLNKNKCKTGLIYSDFGHHHRSMKFHKKTEKEIINWFYSVDYKVVCSRCGLNSDYVLRSMIAMGFLTGREKVAA